MYLCSVAWKTPRHLDIATITTTTATASAMGARVGGTGALLVVAATAAVVVVAVAAAAAAVPRGAKAVLGWQEEEVYGFADPKLTW